MRKSIRRKRVVEFGGLGDEGAPILSRYRDRFTHTKMKGIFVGYGREFQRPFGTKKSPIFIRFGDVLSIPYSKRSGSISDFHMHMIAPTEKIDRRTIHQFAMEWYRVLRPGGKLFLTFELGNGLFEGKRSEHGYTRVLDPLEHVLESTPFRLRYFLSQSGESKRKPVSIEELSHFLESLSRKTGRAHRMPHMPRTIEQKDTMLRHVTTYPLLAELMVVLSKPKQGA